MQEVTIYVDGPDQLKAVYALLAGGTNIHGIGPDVGSGPNVNYAPTSVAQSPTASQESTPSTPISASPSDGERDAAGVLWDANKHASTRGKTKDGLWRMKVGVARPEGEGTPLAGNSSGAASGAAGAPSETASPAVDEDDEFAAFRSAANASAPSTPAARNWTDADLSKLCNQGAVATGNPENVKALIAKYVPEGQQQHSRNIPNEKRETFARDVETTLGIQYAG